MSADNWAQCPRCVARKEQRDEDLARQVKDAYGSMPLEEWLTFRDTTQRDIDETLDSTFREDWEIGTVDGEFYVRYKGVCSTCKLRYEFKHDHTLDVGESA